jgi:hypothetical protein
MLALTTIYLNSLTHSARRDERHAMRRIVDQATKETMCGKSFDRKKKPPKW